MAGYPKWWALEKVTLAILSIYVRFLECRCFFKNSMDLPFCDFDWSIALFCLAFDKKYLAKWNNISPTWIFLKFSGNSLNLSYLFGVRDPCAIAINLTRKSSWWLNHPFEKYARQIGSFPQGSGWRFQKCLKAPPRNMILPFLLEETHHCHQPRNLQQDPRFTDP